MNTKALARHYRSLSPWERLPLIVTAADRGDDLEHQRLLDSAPKNYFRVPDYFGLATSFDRLARMHAMSQLSRACSFWSAWGLLLAYDTPDVGLKRPDLLDQDRLAAARRGARLTACRLLNDAEAWKKLCVGLGIDEHSLLRHLPGYQTIVTTENLAAELIFTPKEATGEEDATSPAPLGNADSDVQAMRDFLDAETRKWM